MECRGDSWSCVLEESGSKRELVAAWERPGDLGGGFSGLTTGGRFENGGVGGDVV